MIKLTKAFILLTVGLLTQGLYAQVKVGDNPTTINSSAVLEAESTTKGFLPPRMTTTQRNAIATPATGLIIFNTTLNCLQWWNGSVWFDACSGSSFGTIPGNTTCAAATISVTPCSAVSGASINDNTGTTDGIEYNWAGATGFVDGGTTQALVEIGGQCWYSRNAVNTPSAYDPAPTWVNSTDVGWSGVYTGGPFTNEGLLYQWSAAMNGSTTERAQGVCPTGWHVPSDCEWMYLENTLGMSTTDQLVNNSWRSSGSVGSKLSTLTSSGTNSSGFTALLAGLRSTNGTFNDRGSYGHWWSSSEASTTFARRRYLVSSQVGVARASSSKANGYSVRCLKD
jgi:uncharacterized protein (TIGR02145 family)